MLPSTFCIVWEFSQDELPHSMLWVHRSPQTCSLQDMLCSSQEQFPRLYTPSVEIPAAFLLGACTHDRGEFITHLPKLHISIRLSDCPQVCLNLWSQSIAAQLDAVTLTSWCLVGTWQPGTFFPILWNRWQCFCSLWNLHANNQHLRLSHCHKQNRGTLWFCWWDMKRIHFQTHQGSAGPEWKRRFQSQRKCMVPQTIRNTSTLVTQVLSLWLKGSPGHVHENSQHYIKTAHGLQPGSSACHGGGLGFATPPDASRGLSHFCMAPTLSTALCKDRNVRGTGQGPTCPHQCPQSPCAPKLVWVHRAFTTNHFGLLLWWQRTCHPATIP